MADLIILRLHPTRPMSGSDFRNLLNGLSITAYDLSFSNNVQGTQIGVARGLADPHLGSPGDNKVDIIATAIIQHYLDVSNPTPPPAIARRLEAVATAVIVAPEGHAEYGSFDLRLKLTRGGTDILDHTFGYNIGVTSVTTPPTTQSDYFGDKVKVSTFVALPPTGVALAPTSVTLAPSSVALAPTSVVLSLPADGQPPKFDDLVSAIDSVLAQDPGGKTLQTLSPLTATQSRQVAAELVWNRTLFPLPSPPRRLGDMYTWPPVNPTIGGDELVKLV